MKRKNSSPSGSQKKSFAEIRKIEDSEVVKPDDLLAVFDLPAFCQGAVKNVNKRLSEMFPQQIKKALEAVQKRVSNTFSDIDLEAFVTTCEGAKRKKEVSVGGSNKKLKKTVVYDALQTETEQNKNGTKEKEKSCKNKEKGTKNLDDFQNLDAYQIDSGSNQKTADDFEIKPLIEDNSNFFVKIEEDAEKIIYTGEKQYQYKSHDLNITEKKTGNRLEKMKKLKKIISENKVLLPHERSRKPTVRYEPDARLLKKRLIRRALESINEKVRARKRKKENDLNMLRARKATIKNDTTITTK